MTRIALATMLLVGLPLTVSGCDQTVIDNVSFIHYDLSGTASDGGTTFIPGKPLPGMLIDRMGRPGINTALTDAFGLVPQLTIDQVKNQYNAATPGNWSSYAARPYIAENLAIFDSFDGNCSNQLLASATLTNTRYTPLANVLADDRLYVNATSGVCTKYLGVETAAPGECGGRHPTMIVMDVTYNLLITGNLTSGWSSGITLDFDGGVATGAAFPFLIPPT